VPFMRMADGGNLKPHPPAFGARLNACNQLGTK
jgi:hypothetical protein